MADDDLVLGMCPACREEVPLMPRHRLTRSHNVGLGLDSYRCSGSGRPAADPNARPPFRQRWWAERAAALREKGSRLR